MNWWTCHLCGFDVTEGMYDRSALGFKVVIGPWSGAVRLVTYSDKKGRVQRHLVNGPECRRLS
jgi:hypothetical protein